MGPDPARRLLGDLTATRAGALHGGCRTDAAAATALSLHLNLTPAAFEWLRIGDVAPDGSAIRPPTTTAVRRPGYGMGSNATPMHAAQMVADRLDTTPRVGGGEVLGWDEFCCREPILIPEHARSIFAAHRAYRVDEARRAPWRVGQGAIDDDPLFIHPREPGRRSPAGSLREAIRRSCRRLRIDPPWIHGDNCRYGADVGLIHRRYGWMVERGLSMLMLEAQYPVGIPQPPPTLAYERLRPQRASQPRW